MELEHATTGFKFLLDRADEEKRELMLSSAKKFVRLYNGMKDPLERARFFNELVDDFHNKQILADPDNAKRIFCKEGCSACCHLPVIITEDEAISMNTYVSELGIEIDHERLNRQREVGREGWGELSIDEQRCAFLDRDTGSCTIHIHRPNSCRNHLALDTNEFCSGDYNENLKSYAILLGHVATTATFNASKTGIMGELIPRGDSMSLQEFLSSD